MIKVIRTAKKDEVKWRQMPSMDFHENYNRNQNSIVVDTNQKFQKHLGFGGAFTEATSYTLSEVTDDVKKEVVEAYFDKEKGLGYNLGRVHIHSCDFGFGNYTYIEEGDEKLETFDISREDKCTIPLIKDCENDIYVTAYENPNKDIVVVAQNDGRIQGLSLIVDGKGVDITLPNESITTFVIKG